MAVYRATFGPGPLRGKLGEAGETKECREIRRPDGWTEVIQGKRVFQSLAPGSELWERKAGHLAGSCLLANRTDEELTGLSKPVIIGRGSSWKLISIETDW